MNRISVIVPIYNAENTLERCVGSILGQTHSDLDVVLIDDGSTDISGTMCDAYAEFDSRVRSFHTYNQGLSAARNFGIEQALNGRSEFIAFVDADDWLEQRMLEEMLAVLESSGADIAQCGYLVDGLRSTNEVILPAVEYGKKKAIEALIKGTIGNYVWDKLYRRHVFNELRFPEGRDYEDIATTYRAILLCDRLVCIPYIGYHYVMREGSISHTTTMKNLYDYWVAWKGRYDCLLTELSGYLNDGLCNELAKGVALAISRTWRWAFANGSKERAQYSDMFHEMQAFVRQNLEDINKRDWPVYLRLSILLARSSTTASLAAGYFANQAFIRLFPEKSGSRR